MLPAANQLPLFTWEIAYEPCFKGLRPSLKLLKLRISNDRALPSSEVLETMPALNGFGIQSVNYSQVYRAETFQPIIQTLYRRIGLQNLEKVMLQCRRMSDDVFSDLLAAFESSLAAFESSRSTKGLVALVSALRLASKECMSSKECVL